MASTDKELEQQLLEAGKRLENPPASVEELLPLLDQVEHCLSRVEQSPTKSMQGALAPSLKALVGDQLFRHANVDVKVAVASCISEITRITAPDAPYDDDQMKDIFQLIVSSFENLADNTSRSYAKRASILETVAKVRSCVVMLDLECDALIVEMFRHFLNAIRDYHPENVFTSMETIMILVLDESEDITPELLSPLLDSVKRGNEEDLPVASKLGDKVLDSFAFKEILPVSRKLGEKVLESCAPKVKPYLVHTMTSLGLSLADYSDVVAAICQDMSVTDDHNDVHAADENKVYKNMLAGGLLDEAAQADNETAAEVALPKQTDLLDDESPKPVVSNGVITQTEEDESLPDLTTPKKQEDSKQAEQSESIDKSNNAEADNLVTEKVVDGESKQQNSSKKRGRKANILEKLMKPCGSSNVDLEKQAKKLSGDEDHCNDGPSSLHEAPSLEVAVSSEQRETGDQVLSPKTSVGDALTVGTAIGSEGLPDESLSRKVEQLKKEGLIKCTVPSADDASKKEPEVTDSETKLQKHLERNVPAKIADEDGKPTMTEASKEKSDTTSESEASLKQPSKKVDISGNGEGSSLKQLEDKKSCNHGKAISDKNVLKISSQDYDNEKISSLMSAAKASKDEQHLETSKTDAKRKQDSGKEKVSDDKESNEDLVGSKIKVWWPLDNRYLLHLCYLF
uniref:Uncharacterized protein n=1 Tax=Rhizophora mucronata TaxID=61149 RepID=A0A2P2LRE1_RHIMU